MDAARLVRDALEGAGTSAQQDIVCLNAAPIFVIAQKAATLSEGVEMARAIIKKGWAAQKLDDWVAHQQSACKTA